MKPIQRTKRRGRALLVASGVGLLAAGACGGSSEIGGVHGVQPIFDGAVVFCTFDDAGNCEPDAGVPDSGVHG